MVAVMFLLAAFFLPLFPFSMGFNGLLSRLEKPRLRGVLLIVWPQLGLLLAYAAVPNLPGWVLYWAVFTAILYGFRAIALRDVGLWLSFLATSTMALFWVPVMQGVDRGVMHLSALGVGVSFVLLEYLCEALRRRFGAAYTGLYSGLAESMPRFSAVFVSVVLVIIGTPVFPAFFLMLHAIQSVSFLVTVIIATTWLLWAWAGLRLVEGLLIGKGSSSVVDLSKAEAWKYVLVLVLMGVGGGYLGMQFTGADV